MGQEVSRYDEDDLAGESGRPRSRGAGHVSNPRKRRWSEASSSDGTEDEDDIVAFKAEHLLAPEERRVPQARRTEAPELEASSSNGEEDEDDVAPVKAETSLAPPARSGEASQVEHDDDQAAMDPKEVKRKRKEEKRAKKEEKQRKKEAKRARKQEAALSLQEQQSPAAESKPKEEPEAEPEAESEVEPEAETRAESQAEPQEEPRVEIPLPHFTDQMEFEERSQIPVVDDKQARKEAKRLKKAAKKARKEASAQEEQNQDVPEPEAPASSPSHKKQAVPAQKTPPPEPMEVVPAPVEPPSEPKEVEVAREPEAPPSESVEVEVTPEIPSQALINDKQARREAKRLRKEEKRARKSAALIEANIEGTPSQVKARIPEIVARVNATIDADVPMVEKKSRTSKRRRHDATEEVVEDEEPATKRRKSEDDSTRGQSSNAEPDAVAGVTTDLSNTVQEDAEQVQEQTTGSGDLYDDVLPEKADDELGGQDGIDGHAQRQTTDVAEMAVQATEMLPPYKNPLRGAVSPFAADGNSNELFEARRRRKGLSGSQRKLAIQLELEEIDAGIEISTDAGVDSRVGTNANALVDAGVDTAQLPHENSNDDPLEGLTGKERQKAKRKLQKLRGRTRERNERLLGASSANLDDPQEGPVEDKIVVASTEKAKEVSLSAPPQDLQQDSYIPEATESRNPPDELQAFTNGVAEEPGAASVEESRVVSVEEPEVVPVLEPETGSVEKAEAVPVEELRAERKERRKLEKQRRKSEKEMKKLRKKKGRAAEEAVSAPSPAVHPASDQVEHLEGVHQPPLQEPAAPTDDPENISVLGSQVVDDATKPDTREPTADAASTHDIDVAMASPSAESEDIEYTNRYDELDSVLGVQDESEIEGDEAGADPNAIDGDEPALADEDVTSDRSHSPVPDSEGGMAEDSTQSRAFSEELGEDSPIHDTDAFRRNSIPSQDGQSLSDAASQELEVASGDDVEVEEDLGDRSKPAAVPGHADMDDDLSEDGAELPEVVISTEQADDQRDDLPIDENTMDDTSVAPSRPTLASRSPSWTFDQYEAVLMAAANYLQTKPENHKDGISVSVEELRNFIDENPTLPQWFSQMEQAGIIFDRTELIEALRVVAPIDEAVRERLVGSKPISTHQAERNNAALQYISERVLLHPDGLLSCVQMFHIGDVCQELGFFPDEPAVEPSVEDGLMESEVATTDRESGDESSAGSAVNTDTGEAPTAEDQPLRKSSRARTRILIEEKSPTPEQSRPPSMHSVDPRLAKLAMSAMEMYDEEAENGNGAELLSQAEHGRSTIHDTAMEDADNPSPEDDPVNLDEDSHEQQDAEPEPIEAEPIEAEPIDPGVVEPEPIELDSAAEKAPLVPHESAQPLIVVHMRSLDSLKPGESFEVLRNGVHAIKVSMSDSPADRLFLRGARMEVLKAIRKAMERPQDPSVVTEEGGDSDDSGGSGAAPDAESGNEGRGGTPNRQQQGERYGNKQQHGRGDRQEAGQTDEQENTQQDTQGEMRQGRQQDMQQNGSGNTQQNGQEETHDDEAEDDVERLQHGRVANVGKARSATTRPNAQMIESLEDNANNNQTVGPRRTLPRNERLEDPRNRLEVKTNSAHTFEPTRILPHNERPEKPRDGLCQRCHQDFGKWYFDNAAVQWICKKCYAKDRRALKSLGPPGRLSSGEGSQEPSTQTPMVSEPRLSRLTEYIPKPANGKCERCAIVATKWYRSDEDSEDWICYKCYIKDHSARPKVVRPEKPPRRVCQQCDSLALQWYHIKGTDQWVCKNCYSVDRRKKLREKKLKTGAPTARNTRKPKELTCPSCQRDIQYHQWTWDPAEVRWTCFACFQRKKRAAQRSQHLTEDTTADVDMEDTAQHADAASPDVAESSQDGGRHNDEESSEHMHTAVNEEDDAELDFDGESQSDHLPRSRSTKVTIH